MEQLVVIDSCTLEKWAETLKMAIDGLDRSAGQTYFIATVLDEIEDHARALRCDEMRKSIAFLQMRDAIALGEPTPDDAEQPF